MVEVDKERLPRHVAIIMDGNGRWATQRGMTRIAGHRRGKDSVREVVEAARRLGIPFLSLYAFSSENWQRPRDEVAALMKFLRHYLVVELKRMNKNGIRLVPIGNLRQRSFREIWRSPEAEAVREVVRRRECHCTTEVFLWSSIVYQPLELAKAMAATRPWRRPLPLLEGERAPVPDISALLAKGPNQESQPAAETVVS
jgi:hypothetical protein